MSDIEFDGGRHHRAKIGYILLATEQTVEDDVYQLKPPGVGVHFTRVPIPDDITVETLSEMTESLAQAARLLLPDGSLDVVCYACTSGSVVIGEEKVLAELSRGAPTAKTTCLITSVIRALNALSAKRIVIATPYIKEINDIEADYLREQGFDVVSIHGLNLRPDSDMIRVTPAYWLEFAAGIDQTDADVIFISCSAVRSIDIIDELEQRLGKPVITSNQAMIWDTLRLAGINDHIQGYGQLLSQY